MSAAEFRIARERLGLSGEMLSERLGVQLRTVRRWEHGHSPVPDGIVTELDDLDQTAERFVDELAELLDQTGHRTLSIPKNDQDFPFPAGWWRMIAARVAEQIPDVRIRYQTPQGQESAEVSVPTDTLEPGQGGP